MVCMTAGLFYAVGRSFLWSGGHQGHFVLCVCHFYGLEVSRVVLC